MQNMIEYLNWRGDITFEKHPLCEADYLVMAELAYMRFDGIVSESRVPETNLGAALSQLISENDKKSADVSLEVSLFLKAVTDSPRFSMLKLCGYVSVLDEERQEQFSAVTFLVPADGCEDRAADSVVVAFRGTDSTLVGWKEDFNMAFIEAVPAQLDAVKYIEKTAAEFPDADIHVCGHSKGGNLAVYGSAFCEKQVQDRIVAVRSLDGPGFRPEIIAREGFGRILDRTETIVPSSSIVGILLEHAEEFIVIRSYAVSTPYQHNPFTWEISRCGYVPVERISDSSRYIDDTMRKWVSSMSPELREKFINGIYNILTGVGVRDIGDIFTKKSMSAILRTLKNLDPETARVLIEGITLFHSAAGTGLPGFIERLRNSQNRAEERL